MAGEEVAGRWELVRAILAHADPTPDPALFLVNKLFCAEMRRLNSVVVREGDDLHAAFRNCPDGGWVILERGNHILTETLIINKNVSVVGEGATRSHISTTRRMPHICVQANHVSVTFSRVSVHPITFIWSCKRLNIHECVFWERVRCLGHFRFSAVSSFVNA